jgi:hypothetical protein
MKAMNSATTERPQPAPRSAYMSFVHWHPLAYTDAYVSSHNNVVYSVGLTPL